jgi:glycosyltransferase involved in cell wall biosynthesis
MPRRRILLVAPISPPSTLSAAHRIAGLTRHLAAQGHAVTVLTSVVSGSGPIDGAERTVRARDLMVSPLNWRRANFEALTSGGDQGYDPRPSALASWVVPDLELVGWLPFALPKAVAIASGTLVDCVITSSPPHSAHLIGLALQARGIPWVADFRDGWTFEPTRRPYPLGAQRRLDVWLERLVATRADAVVGVTPPITDDLRERFGADAVTITNGFDPKETGSRADPGWRPPLADDRHSIVYTGSLSYAGNNAEPLLDAIDLLLSGDPTLDQRVEVVFAGPMTPAERDALSARGSLVRVLGRLPRSRTLALQRAADSLLLLAGDHRPSVATGKLYEYLAAQRPVVVVGASSVAARIVQEMGAGLVAQADDPADIARALMERITSVGRVSGADPEAVARRFGYPSLARQMADRVDVAIATARARA